MCVFGGWGGGKIFHLGDRKNVGVKEQRAVFGKKKWAQFVTLCYEGRKKKI